MNFFLSKTRNLAWLVKGNSLNLSWNELLIWSVKRKTKSIFCGFWQWRKKLFSFSIIAGGFFYLCVISVTNQTFLIGVKFTTKPLFSATSSWKISTKPRPTNFYIIPSRNMRCVQSIIKTYIKFVYHSAII